jgi:hypothetical protein
MKQKTDLTKLGPNELLFRIWDTPKLYAQRYNDSILDLFVYTDVQYTKLRNALSVDFGENHDDTQEVY